METTHSWSDMEKRLIFVLHRGLVEARLLAISQQTEQLHDLADALEPIPGHLFRWRRENLDAISKNLHTYQEKYCGKCFEYVAFLEQYPVPEF